MSNTENSSNLGSLRICVEKPLRVEEHAITSLKHDANSDDHFTKLRAAFFTQKLWPKKSTITISFYPRTSNSSMASWTPIDVMLARREPDGSSAVLDPIEYKIRSMSLEDGIRKVVDERIAPICGLNFVFVASGGNVRIGFDASGGSWSLIGTDCLKTDKKTMNFAWLDASTIMHEFGHVLGMIHEHQNPKGNTIDWNVPVVDAWAKQTQNWSKETTYRNIIQRYNINQINGSQYDPRSIMLYYFPSKMTLNNKGTNMNLRLSPTDVEYIQKMYPGGMSSPSMFYAQVYHENLNGTTTKSWTKLPLVLVWLIPLIIVVIFVLYFVSQKITWKKKSGRYS